MKRKNYWLLSVSMIFMALIFMGTGCNISSGSSSIPTEEKKHVEATAEWAYLTFEETVEKADIIIYGTAVNAAKLKLGQEIPVIALWIIIGKFPFKLKNW